jgi:hypothetical protein
VEIRAKVARGPRKGAVLLPHRYANGSYAVSATRFEKDYHFVSSLEEVVRHLGEGMKLRMSPENGGSPSLISPQSIEIDGVPRFK